MAEIGLLRFARLAYEVGSTVLPAQRTRFSKRLFTQPQLLAVLCLMRFEDWTFREAEVRLSEHRELRAALELTAAPDHTTLYRFLLRLNEDNLRKVLGEIVRRVPRRYRRRSSGGRCNRSGAERDQQFLRAPHASSHATAHALATLVEVAHRGRCGPAVDSGAKRTAGTME